MEGILDSILENHGKNSGPVIVSENHDLNSISTGGSKNSDDPLGIQKQIASIRAGNWDQAEYGRSAEEQIAILEAADTPEKREQAMKELRQRAIDRASFDTSNGRINAMVVVGPRGEKPSWSTLGVGVAEAVNAEQAAKLGGLTFKVIKLAAEYEFNGVRKTSEDAYLLIRDDTGAELGRTGPRYQPIQNQDGFDFLNTVLEEFGAKYESVGSVYGGKKTWMQAHLPSQSFSLLGNDVNEAYATFFLDHTGNGADYCYPSILRIECANTMRMANKGKGKGIRIPHMGNIKQKITAARQALGITVKSMETYKEVAEAMVTYPLSVEELGNAVLDDILEFTQEQVNLGVDGILDTILQVDASKREAEAKRVERALKKRDNILEDILLRHETKRCNPKGSAWASFNAVTESADYGKWGKERTEDQASRRMESILVGERDTAKQLALQYIQNKISAN